LALTEIALIGAQHARADDIFYLSPSHPHWTFLKDFYVVDVII
jgi:hypothetical protein